MPLVRTTRTAATSAAQPHLPAPSCHAATGAPDGAADLITPDEAAAMLKVGRKVLERWRGTGTGPAFVRLTSKSIRYRQRDVQAFVDACVRASTAA